jgi:type I restriction enzyme S subunit
MEKPMATTDWQSLRWGDIVDLLYGRQLRDYHGTNGPYRVFGTNGPIGWASSVLCDHASVIIGRKGAYRGVHYSSQPFFAIDTAFYIEPKVEIDARWAYYELLTHDINALDSGSAIPSTSRESFCALPVQLPPLSEQRAIAHILGAMDDKIELNRRMNETLEAMARALFKSWSTPRRPPATPASPQTLPPSSPTPLRTPTWATFQKGGQSGVLAS